MSAASGTDTEIHPTHHQQENGTMFIIQLCLYVLGFVVTIATMIYGWGLTPESWLWIIGGGAASSLLIAISLALGERK